MYKTFLLLWLTMVINGQLIKQEVTRKLCPPMENVNQPPSRTDTSERVKKLREEMIKTRLIQGPAIDAYIVMHYDVHMNDFVADHDKRLEYITGYTGDYGIAVITKNKSAFWTDELHYYQAENELSCNWIIYKTDFSRNISSVAEWLSQELQVGMRVGVDPKMIPNTEWDQLTRALALPYKTMLLWPVVHNLVDVIWTTDRPNATDMQAYTWLEEYAGRTWRNKLNSLRTVLKEMEADALVISSLSEIAWLLNIRGFDLPYGPFLKAFVVVSKEQLHLYTSLEKLSLEVKTHLATEACVSPHCARLHDYEEIWTDLRKISTQWKKVIIPSTVHYSAGASRAIFLLVTADKRKPVPSPLIGLIAEKNEKEKMGMKKAHIRDAVIFCNLMANIDAEMQRSAESFDELALVNMTNEYRLKNEFSRSISYPTVVASGHNTGVPLYIPNNLTNILVDEKELLIIDGGAHYWDGTTAVARTFRLDTNSIAENDIQLYTRLLMGLVDFASLSFPPYLHTSQLDIIARLPLWQKGMDYPHATGHGIGVFLDVYEAPIDIDYRNGLNTTLRDGYFLLAEVGYYQEEQFGMKLSMVLQVIYKNDSSGFLTFEPITLVPFEDKMINSTMLSLQQKIWLNDYNDRIRTTVVEELRRQNLNNGYNWVVDRINPILLAPEEPDNGSAGLQPSRFSFLFLALTFVVRFVF